MILQALYQYYQQMRAAGTDIAPYGMIWREIPFIIELTPKGEFIQISETIDSQNKKGQLHLVPRPSSSRTNKIVANIMWDHLGYILGVSEDGSEKKEKIAPTQNRYFIEKVNQLKELYPENPHISAVARFYQDGHALRLVKEETTRIKQIQGVTGANLSFRVRQLEDDSLVASIQDVQPYMNRSVEFKEDNEGHTSVCLVTGKKEKIARLHPKVIMLNAPFISIQESCGFDSYGKERGFNAPISVHVAEYIATALDDLLAKGKDTNFRVRDTTFIFWSNLADEELLTSYRTATFSGISGLFDGGKQVSTEENKSKKRRKRNQKKASPIDPSTESIKVLRTLKAACGHKDGKIYGDNGRFYILGLTPNVKRISVKLWAEGSISEIVGNTLRHQYDMNIVSQEGNVDVENPPIRSIYQIVKAVSASDKWSANLIQSIVESIVENKPYPHSLQQACLKQIRHGKLCKDKKDLELGAAILKAYINRKKQQKFITMSLDPNQTNKAYLAGRLFALFENIQQHALGKDLNRTIRDAYYSTASSTPRTVFGRLDALSKVHLSKLRKEKPGLAFTREKQLEEIYDLVTGGDPKFPAHFTLDDQSIFAVGYYHQRVELWRKKEKDEETPEE